MSRTPSYVLVQAVSISYGPMDYKILDAGTYISPLQYCYVPQHVIDDPFNKYFNADTEVFAYTKFGIVAIPKRSIREK